MGTHKLLILDIRLFVAYLLAIATAVSTISHIHVYKC